jgi:phospholipase B1
VIGAIGDSLTAANGAKATLLTGLLIEERGISWSIGSENKNLEKLVTLPSKYIDYDLIIGKDF